MGIIILYYFTQGINVKFKIRFILPLAVVMMLNLNCNEESENPVTTGETPQISKISIPDKWNTLTAVKYKIEVTVTDPQGFADLAGAYFTVESISTGEVFFTDSLYDDGSYYFPSGDVLAGDGIFSNRYETRSIASPLSEEGYMFSFLAVDKHNHESAIEQQTVFFGPDSRPQIQSVTAPDSLTTTINDIIMNITVSDSDGVDDIMTAFFESQKSDAGFTKFEQYLYNDGDFINNGDITAGDSVFSARLNPDFVSGKQGNYRLLFYVQDTYGELNDIAAEHLLYIGNLPGKFLQITAPDTLQIPSGLGSYNRGLLTASVSDPEGLSDIDSVYFFSLKPDSTYANNGLPFLMVDNGQPFNILNPLVESGDSIAGDGIYSLSLLVYDDANPGLYTFTFYMRDKAGNLSSPAQKKIHLSAN
jgi:hypothetical protein